MDIALSLLISYIASNIPTVKHIIIGNKSIHSHLDKCFKKAVDRWDYPDCAKDSICQNMDKYLIHLKEFITRKQNSRHPKEYELLQLWAEEILNTPDCCQYINNLQNEEILTIVNTNREQAADILRNVDSLRFSINNINEIIKSISCPTTLTCHSFWKRWATGKDICLPTKILLSNRQQEKNYICETTIKPQYIRLKSNSIDESFAFACASILELNDNSEKRTVVVTNPSEYEILMESPTPLIIITNIHINHIIAVEKGHSIIHCVGCSDINIATPVLSLPEIDREKFIESLNETGLNKIEARDLARDVAYDVNILRRRIVVSYTIPTWLTEKNIDVLIACSIIGEWNDNVDGDKDLVSHISGISYDGVLSIVEPLRFTDDSPIVKIGNIWRVKSSYDLMRHLIHNITTINLRRIGDVVDMLNLDDDPNAIEKMEEKGLRFWENRQVYSPNIKEGIYYGIALYSVINELNGNQDHWTDCLITKILSEYNISKYLSNRRYLCIFAEASPSSVIQFIKNDIESGANIISQLFIPREKQFSITGSEIYYTEFLNALERIAWGSKYLYEVTDILLFATRFSHDKNYANSPLNSLRQIYRFILPQTLVESNERIAILSSLNKKYPMEIYNLILCLIKDLQNGYFTYNPTFRWRLRGCQNHKEYITPVQSHEITSIVQLMLNLYDNTVDNFCSLLELSFCRYIDCVRHLIITKLQAFKEIYVGNMKVVELLRKEIYQQRAYKDTRWALSENELEQYIILLKYIEPKDILLKNKHYFDDFNIEDPEHIVDDTDYSLQMEQFKAIRNSILREIISANGIESVYELSHIVENHEPLAISLVSMYGANIAIEIYKRFVENSITLKFVVCFFHSLYYSIGEKCYLELVENLRFIDKNSISVVLYSPNYNTTLAVKAGDLSQSIEQDYWENVSIWSCENKDVDFAITHLRAVHRYSSIIYIIHKKDIIFNLTDSQKINVLSEAISYPDQLLNSNIKHYIGDILLSIGHPNEENLLTKLLQIEFILYDVLNGFMDVRKLHIYSVLNRDSSLMIQLIQLANLTDEDEFVSEEEKRKRVAMATFAWRFLYNYKSVPCTDNEGTTNYDDLLIYLKNVRDVCKSMALCKHTIGKIISNISEDDNYPSQEICLLVESLHDDEIDSEIGCELFNKRGSFCTSPFAGGYRERGLIKLFETYRQRALPYSPRMVKIFTQLIQGYERDAEIEDNNSRLLGLKY